jgi:hypothetical protein
LKDEEEKEQINSTRVLEKKENIVEMMERNETD